MRKTNLVISLALLYTGIGGCLGACVELNTPTSASLVSVQTQVSTAVATTDSLTSATDLALNATSTSFPTTIAPSTTTAAATSTLVASSNAISAIPSPLTTSTIIPSTNTQVPTANLALAFTPNAPLSASLAASPTLSVNANLPFTAIVASITGQITNITVGNFTITTPVSTSSAASIVVEAPDPEEEVLISQVNNVRIANGRPALTWNLQLFKSARWMAQDISVTNKFSHTDTQGRTPTQRAKDYGFSTAFIGENIAGGKERAIDILNIWLSDDEHKNNLLAANYRTIGAGRFYNPNSINKWYWVLELG